MKIKKCYLELAIHHEIGFKFLVIKVYNKLIYLNIFKLVSFLIKITF